MATAGNHRPEITVRHLPGKATGESQWLDYHRKSYDSTHRFGIAGRGSFNQLCAEIRKKTACLCQSFALFKAFLPLVRLQSGYVQMQGVRPTRKTGSRR